MHRPIFGHSFAVLVAPILLSVLAFNFLKRKKAGVRRDGGDSDAGASGSPTVPTEANSDASTPSTASAGNRYDVFLSFRGPDTREGFTDHLYNGFVDAGIRAFRDDNELRQGEQIGPDLLAAIMNSKILIPIISVSYGSSKWCLDELVQIMECKNKNTGHLVLPIFYKVEPAHVRHQIGSFGDIFRKREKRFDPTAMEKWKQALKEVSDLKGWEAKGYEGELVKKVVQKVLSELKKEFELVIPENLVGMDSHVEKVIEFVDYNFSATLFVGIHGMGGIGKTTLAKTIYNKLSDQFEYRSFIADIRESCKRKGLEYLQNQLIFNVLKQKIEVYNKDEGIKFISSKFKGKKVLIFLDDVDNDDQLKALAGNHNWFSSGSRIVITTRNKSILDNAGVDYNYEHKEMNANQSSILFCRHAFRGDSPPSEFEDLTHKVVSTTGGLPLSLEVLGSFLCGKKPTIWYDTINKLRKVPHKKVREKLRISYEELEHEQKQIFLDIACFFVGTDGRIASYMWDDCGFFPEEGIEVLRFMSLVKVGDDHELIMHDQLRDLGREIVREENQQEPQYRSRLWDSKEAMKVLKGYKGTEKIQAIDLSKCSSEGSSQAADQDGNFYTSEKFKNLTSLRFLDMSGAHLSGDFKNSIQELKWLQWWYCPSTFEANNLLVKELVVLNLGGSNISDEWRGWRPIMMAKKLKYLDLTSCQSLKGTFFLSAFKNLEVLILRYCEKLEQIDSSIGDMKSLVCLDLTGCHNLKELPIEVGKLKALKQFLLHRCRNISVIPDTIGALQNLEILNIGSTRIIELPDSIGALQNLKILEISFAPMKELPDSIGALRNLEVLNISYTWIKKLPDRIEALENLETLKIRNTWIKELPRGIGRLTKLRDLDASSSQISVVPESIRNLSSLERLNFDKCKEIQSLPELPSSLTRLAVACRTRRLPSLSRLTQLKTLRLHNCKFLECVSELPSTALELSECFQLTDVEGPELLKSLNTPFNLEVLVIMRCKFMQTLDVSQLSHLRILRARLCNNLLEVRGLDKLKYLKILSIAQCASIKRLHLPEFGSMKELQATYCENLVEIQGLDRLEFLEELHISGCRALERLDLSKSAGLTKLYAQSCESLVEIQGLDKLEVLKVLNIARCYSIQRLKLPKSLKLFGAKNCKNLVEIQGLDRLEFLEVLIVSGCTSFGRLPDLCCFDTLQKLAINCLDKLHDIQSLERFPCCTSLRIEDCKSLAKLPNLSNFRDLQKLSLSNCHELQEIPGLEEATSLERVAISGCSSIKILPDLSSCTNLSSLAVQNCEKLTEIRGLEKLHKQVELNISGCKSLTTLPELSRMWLYKEYEKDPSGSDHGTITIKFLEDDSGESFIEDDLDLDESCGEDDPDRSYGEDELDLDDSYGEDDDDDLD